MPKPTARPTWTLTVEALDDGKGGTPVSRFRIWLKDGLRRLGLRVVRCVELRPADGDLPLEAGQSAPDTSGRGDRV